VTYKRLFPIVALALAACSDTPVDDSAERVNRIASDFVHGYFSQFPEEVYEVGYGGAPMNRFGDHSEAAMAEWDAKIDHWLMSLDDVDVETLAGTPEAVTYVFTREQLQTHVDRRVCQTDLWNVSPTWTGWQFMFASTLAIQPIDSAAEQQAAVDRVVDAARFLKTDISNLRRGLDQGYSAPQSGVIAVVDQVTSLIDTPTEDSPLFSPAARSELCQPLSRGIRVDPQTDFGRLSRLSSQRLPGPRWYRRRQQSKWRGLLRCVGPLLVISIDNGRANSPHRSFGNGAHPE
jgi:uncharacterized protein (DUF885 family)